MNWSLKAIGYWLLLIACLTSGVLLTGYSFLFWSINKNFAFGIENVVGLSSGVALLLIFFIYFQDRKFFPLKKMKDSEERTDLELEDLAAFHPNKIELDKNLNGMRITHSCGAPSHIRFRAIQLSPASDSREEDYERTFYNSVSGEIVRYDKSRPDHQELYEHFLWIIDSSRKSVLPKSYLEQYNIIKPEPSAEKSTETIH